LKSRMPVKLRPRSISHGRVFLWRVIIGFRASVPVRGPLARRPASVGSFSLLGINAPSPPALFQQLSLSLILSSLSCTASRASGLDRLHPPCRPLSPQRDMMRRVRKTSRRGPSALIRVRQSSRHSLVDRPTVGLPVAMALTKLPGFPGRR
jgi:hypothetical protein